MLFRTKQQENFTVVIFTTRNLLNGMDIEAVEKALGTLLAAKSPQILLDFKHVRHLSSQMLSMLLRVHLRLQDVPGGELSLCCLTPDLMAAVKITQLHRIVPVFPSREEAIEASKKQRK